MISIVVCHRDEVLLEQFQLNVKKTIGIPFEFVTIDNRKNKYSIFEAYNRGIDKSKYDVVCFAHEDLLFHTQSWGLSVLKHFEDEKTGMIGVVGGNALPNCPSPWWNNTLLNDHLVHNIQHWKDGFVPKRSANSKPYASVKNCTLELYNPFNEHKSKAVALDGLWMCAHKRVFETCEFDSDTFKGFHCYDTDICLQIGQHFDIYVVYDILIEHLSMGSVKESWAKEVEKLADKWKDTLPLFSKEINKELVPNYNAKCLLTYCYWIQSMGFSDVEIRKIISKYIDYAQSIKNNKELLLLILWSKTNYKIACKTYRILKYLA